MTVKNIPPYLSHFDGNQVPSITGVEGTLGTTDTGGTARPMPIGVNPTTGAMYVQDLSGASGTTNVQIVGGTYNLGTVAIIGTVPVSGASAGTFVNVSTGTQQTLGTVGTVIGVGTISNIVTTSGTVIGVGTISNNVTVVQSISSNLKAQISGIQAAGGTATNNPIIVAGTDVGGTVRNLVLDINGGLTVGTVTTGTVIGIGTLTNIGNLPTLNLTTGTITTGSITNIAMIHNGTLASSGTTTGVGVVTTVTTVSNLTDGTVRMSVGTLTTGTLQNLVTGTINALASGTITGGTLGNLNSGTVQINKTPVQIGTSYHVLGTAGASFWGTIIAASGAGTKQYVSRVSVAGVSGTVDVAVTNIGVGGSTGAGVLERLTTIPQAGITNNYDPVIPSGTNGTLAYWLSGAGTVNITVNYWQGV